jgi:hypothetical protein
MPIELGGTSSSAAISAQEMRLFGQQSHAATPAEASWRA